MKDKIKLTDRRVLLSNRYIQTLKPKDKRYSKGDSEVIGLRIFVFAACIFPSLNSPMYLFPSP